MKSRVQNVLKSDYTVLMPFYVFSRSFLSRIVTAFQSGAQNTVEKHRQEQNIKY